MISRDQSLIHVFSPSSSQKSKEFKATGNEDPFTSKMSSGFDSDFVYKNRVEKLKRLSKNAGVVISEEFGGTLKRNATGGTAIDPKIARIPQADLDRFVHPNIDQIIPMKICDNDKMPSMLDPIYKRSEESIDPRNVRSEESIERIFEDAQVHTEERAYKRHTGSCGVINETQMLPVAQLEQQSQESPKGLQSA